MYAAFRNSQSYKIFHVCSFGVWMKVSPIGCIWVVGAAWCLRYTYMIWIYFIFSANTLYMCGVLRLPRWFSIHVFTMYTASKSDETIFHIKILMLCLEYIWLFRSPSHAFTYNFLSLLHRSRRWRTNKQNLCIQLKWIFNSCYSHQCIVQNSKGLRVSIGNVSQRIFGCMLKRTFEFSFEIIYCSCMHSKKKKTFPIPIGNNRFYRKWFEEPSTRSIFTRHSEITKYILIDLPFFHFSYMRSFSPFRYVPFIIIIIAANTH